MKAQVSHLGLTKLFKPVYFKKDEHTVQRSTEDSVERQRVLKKRCSTILEENTKLPKISYIRSLSNLMGSCLYHILMYNRNNSIIAKNLKNINLKSATDDMRRRSSDFDVREDSILQLSCSRN